MTNAVSFRMPEGRGRLTFNPCCLYDINIPFTRSNFEEHRKEFKEANTFLPGCHKCEFKEQTHD